MWFAFFLLIHGHRHRGPPSLSINKDVVLKATPEKRRNRKFEQKVRFDEANAKSFPERCKCSPLAASDDSLQTLVEAEQACDKLTERRNDTLVYVPYVSVRKRNSKLKCELQWCCKDVTPGNRTRIIQSRTQAVSDISELAAKFVPTLIQNTNTVIKRGASILQNGDKMMPNTQESVAVIHLAVMNATQGVIDQILLCTTNTVSLENRKCGNLWVFAANMRRVAKDLDALITNYTGVLDLVEYGSESPGKVAKNIRIGRRNVAHALTRLRGGLISAVMYAPAALADATSLITRQLWRRRMLVYVFVMVLVNTATLSGILMTTMLTTHSETTVVPVFESIIGQIISKIICPLVGNSIAVGFVAHWIVDQVILSEAGQKIIATLLSPVTYVFDSFQILRNLISRNRSDAQLPLAQQIVAALKTIHDNPTAIAAYTILYSQVSGFLRVASGVICTGLHSVFTAKDIAVNTADVALTTVSDTAGSYFTDTFVWLKSAVGIDTDQVRAARENQQRLDLLEKGNLIHKVLLAAHTALSNVEKWKHGMYEEAEWGVETLQKHLDGEGRDLLDTLGRVFEQLHGPWMTSIIGAGAATMTAGSTRFQDFFGTRKKNVDPSTIKTFKKDEKAEFETTLAEAREFKLLVQRTVDEKEEDFSSRINDIHMVMQQMKTFKDMWHSDA